VSRTKNFICKERYTSPCRRMNTKWIVNAPGL
jgi:hypothetical protein